MSVEEGLNKNLGPKELNRVAGGVEVLNVPEYTDAYVVNYILKNTTPCPLCGAVKNFQPLDFFGIMTIKKCLITRPGSMAAIDESQSHPCCT